MPSLPQLAHSQYPNPEQSDYHSVNDMTMVHGLMKNPRYNIPDNLRDKIIKTAGQLLDSDIEDPVKKASTQLAAAKVLLEADKRNIDIVRLSMPQKHMHINVQQASTEQLQAQLKELLLNNPSLIPVEIVKNGQ